MPHPQKSLEKPKPRVLCVTQDLGRGGGAEQLLAGLLPELRNHGYECELVALCDWPDDIGYLLEEQGLVVHRLHLSHRWDFFVGIRKLRALLAARTYDLAWGHLFDGNLYATFVRWIAPNMKTVITLHTEGYSQSPPRTVKGRVFIFLEKTLLTRTAAKVAVSAAVARDFEAVFGWRDIAVIHNGVVASEVPPRPDDARRSQIRAEHGISPDDFMIVTPSRFIPKKGHAVLLDALDILNREKSWLPRLVARGLVTPLLDQLRARAAELGLREAVNFAPPVPHDQLFPLIQSADAVVIPSLREPFGIAAAEAMLLGVPVVLTRVDGFVELVGDSEGALMVSPGDARSLAEAIWSLKADPDLRRRVAERGRARIAENFEMSVCASKWARLFDRVRGLDMDSNVSPTHGGQENSVPRTY
ncbi:MAG TPA: glycosyltransferase family 4 protein [Methylocella sp.]